MAMTMPQGLRLEPMVADIQRLLKVGARMYMCMTRATLDRHGRDGEMPVRLGLRAYGHWRGTEMREAHHALGLDINMRNLIQCWDSASVFIVKDREDTAPDYKPFDTRFDVHLCPASMAWKEDDFHQWGHVYCDEFHQACASTYHPDGHVVIPENLMKGDDHCHFQWVMPPDAEKLDLGEPTELGRRLARDYQAESDIEGAWQALKRTNRLVGGRFVTAARVLVEKFGDDGVETIRDAMRRWGRMRGEHLRVEHEEAGIPISPASFMRHHDLPRTPSTCRGRRSANRAKPIVVDEFDESQALSNLGRAHLVQCHRFSLCDHRFSSPPPYSNSKGCSVSSMLAERALVRIRSPAAARPSLRADHALSRAPNLRAAR